MDPHHSPQNNIPAQKPASYADPLAGETLSVKDLAQKTILSFRGPNFTLTIAMRPGGSRRLDSLTVEMYLQDGTPVAAYRTSSLIPERISSEIKRIDRVYSALRAPETFLKETIHLLKTHSMVEWDCEEFHVPSPKTGTCRRFHSITPSLMEFAERPSIIDERLEARVLTEQGVARLSALMNPSLGFMRCRLETDSESHEWKIKANFEQSIIDESLRADLSRKALDLLGRLYLDGAATVIDLLHRGHFEARAVPRNESASAQIDRYLARGIMENVERSTSLEHSSASVSLQVGIRWAALRIEPCQHDYSRTITIIFNCTDKYPELTGFQLHHIETAYKLMSSSSSGDRHRGAGMCDPAAGIRLHPFTGQSLYQVSPMGMNSIFSMGIQCWGPAPDIIELLGQSAADEILSIPNISVFLPSSGSVEQLVNTLDGGREIVAVPSSIDPSGTASHCFRVIRCALLNDGSIRVNLRNSLEGAYQAVISPEQISHSGSSAEVITSLFRAFQGSTGDR